MSATDMYGDPTWHMSTSAQITTLVIAVGVVAVICFGAWTVIDSVRKDDKRRADERAAVGFCAAFIPDSSEVMVTDAALPRMWGAR